MFSSLCLKVYFYLTFLFFFPNFSKVELTLKANIFCFQSAGIGGAAHLVNFEGTDTIAALTIAKNFYNCDIAGYSIPAAEHR